MAGRWRPDRHGPRIDDDRVPANEHGRAVAVGGHDGAMQVVGNEPEHATGRAGQARPAARGSKGSAASPRQSPMYAHWVGWLMAPNGP